MDLTTFSFQYAYSQNVIIGLIDSTVFPHVTFRFMVIFVFPQNPFFLHARLRLKVGEAHVHAEGRNRRQREDDHACRGLPAC